MPGKHSDLSDAGPPSSAKRLWIETERLIIHGIEDKDLQAFHAIASQHAVADMLASVPHPLSIDDARDWLSARNYAGVPGFVAGIFLRDGDLIGCIGLTDYPRTVNYFIAPDHWGRGYATEVLSSFLRWCADSFALDEYWVGVMDTNKGSCKVLEKVGFEVMYASRFQSDVRTTPDRLLIYWKGYGAEAPLVQHTPQLFLCPLHLAHGKRLSELTDDADVAEILPGIQLPFSPENAKQWIAEAEAQEGTFPMALVLKDGRLIGAGRIEAREDEGSIVIWVGREHRRQGLGLEAYGGLVELAFNRFPSLESLEFVVGDDNTVAIRMLEALKFSLRDSAPKESGSLVQDGNALAYRLERESWSD